jgi:monothiol glutaredoxin|tara:strand:+ start:447 stop:842 length:396 start_codon:yes stop_codon:yes gene_type:complete
MYAGAAFSSTPQTAVTHWVDRQIALDIFEPIDPDHTLEETAGMADSPQIIAWLKPVCGWSNGVREVFQKYGLEYDDRDIINNPDIYAEMVQKSGQPLSPCVEVNGQMLADVSGEEVETWLVDNKVVETVAG